MAVAANGSWKIPLGYFLISSLNAEEKARFLSICLKKLFDANVKSIGVTCDGLASNFAALKILGASFDISNLQSTFPHPSDPKTSVAVFIDACHLLKLVRNALSDLQVFKDHDGKEIRCDLFSIRKIYFLL